MREAEDLLNKYQEGKATKEEKAWLESWYGQHRVDGPILTPDQLEEEHKLGFKQIQKRIRSRHIHQPKVRIAVAAALIALCIVGIFIWRVGQTNSEHVVIHTSDIQPGNNRATLSLSDGRIIALSENQTGIVIEDQTIRYPDGSPLPDQIGAVSTAILNVPKGGQYQITLSDGTKVWLNAASTLIYPSQFNQQERIVELQGEAYFEVAHNGKPFLVKTKGQIIEVLGTQFNVNAYSEQSSTTTLQSGSIRVRIAETGQATVLQPNQQAIVSGRILQIATVDPLGSIAWKDGFFVFDNIRLEDAMTQIGRWYDAEIYFESEELRNERFSGSLSKYTHLSQVLRKLALTGSARFEIKDRQIIIK